MFRHSAQLFARLGFRGHAGINGSQFTWGTAAALSLMHMTFAAGLPVNPVFNLVRPSTTGVPGEEVRVMTFDPQGNLWIAARWPFWGEIGLAMLPASELPYTPLPGGGFDTGKWTVWSNVHHPIPSPYIEDIEFGPDGVMWIASDGGLTRFDRHAKTPQDMWHTYTPGNSPLILNEVRSIDMDSQGNLWLTNVSVQYAYGALFRFNATTNAWTMYQVGNQLPWYLPWQDINAVFVSADDHVWLTHSVLGGLAEFDGTSWVLHDNGLHMGGMLEDLQGNIWLTSWYGLWKFDRFAFENFDLGSQGTVTALGIDVTTGMVYAGAWYGNIYKIINGNTPQFFVNADNIPGNICPRPNGEIWINNYGGNGTLGTVRHYTSAGQLLERFNTYNSGLPDYFMDNIQSDHSGHLWFACGEGGLSRMEVPNGAATFSTCWRNWGNHNDLSEPYPFAGNEPMYSIYHHPDGTIYMGGNGIAQWDPATGTFLDFWNWQNSSIGVDSFIAIAQDGNDDLWIASDYTGIYRLNPQTNDWEQHLFGAPWTTANYVNDMVRDLDGNLWVATQTGLHLFNGTTWFAITIWHGSPVEIARHLAVHPDGSLWIGASNGLIRYQNAVWTVYDETNSPMPARQVQGLEIRSDGLIGFSVSNYDAPTPFPNGVVLYDGTNWRVFSYGTNPLPHYQLGDVEFDAQGDIWVSTISEGVVEIVLHPTGDITGNGTVDIDDLLGVINAWGACPVPPTTCPADVTGNGTVDIDDLLIVINNWG